MRSLSIGRQRPSKDISSKSSWLEPMRAVGAEADDVLEEDLVVGLAQARVVARELQADAAELARAPIDHHGLPLRVVAAEDREIRRRARAGIDQAERRRAGIELVIAVAGAPLRNELIHALQVPARRASGVAPGH